MEDYSKEYERRPIAELLEVMLNNQQCFEEGLCMWVVNIFTNGRINHHERVFLRRYIKENEPSMFSSIDAFVSRISLSRYYWTPWIIDPRIKWIKKHIKLNQAK